MVVPKNRKSWKLLVLGLGWYMENMCVLRVFVPGRFHENPPVQTRLAATGKTGGRKKLELPPLTQPANPEKHVFIPLEDCGRKVKDLFQGQEFVFIRGGVGVGKSTLRLQLARQNRETFVSVPFQNGREATWRTNIIRSIEIATKQNVKEGDTQLEDALALAATKKLILVLDEAHTIFSLDVLRTSLFKSDPEMHPRLVLLSASGEAGTGMMSTTPSEIKRKIFWTPPVPEVDADLINQLRQAGVRLDKDSVDFFMKFCGGHRSIFMAAMDWVKAKQKNGSQWVFNQTVTKVRNSMDANSWSAKDSILGGLSASRAVKVNGQFIDLKAVPLDFIKILCEGPGQLHSADQRRALTINGFVVPLPEAAEEEFRDVDWTQTNTQYVVSNPILASYYRDQLERFCGLKVRVDPFLPVNCMDLLLRAIPYVTFAQVVGFPPKAAAGSSLSEDDLPFEDQYNAAIIQSLQRLGYAAASCHHTNVGKVDIFANVDTKTFSVECIMAKRAPADHAEHRGRFDRLESCSSADHKALVTVGSLKSRVRARVLKTKADGVEIIGLVPNIAHTGLSILYRGLGAKSCPTRLLKLTAFDFELSIASPKGFDMKTQEGK